MSTVEHHGERFESIGDHVHAIIRYAVSGGLDFDRRLVLQATATGLNSTVPSEGGFLVGTEHSLKIWEKAYSVGAILRRTTAQPVTTKSGALRIPTVSEASRENGSRYGGMALGWLDQGAQFPQSNPKYSSTLMQARLLGGVVHLTTELTSDSPAFEEWFPRAGGREIAFSLEDCIVNGTGSGQPLGILNADATITVTAESGQAAGTVQSENCSAMGARFWSGSYDSSGAAWLCGNEVFRQMEDQRLANGSPLIRYENGNAFCMKWPVIVNEVSLALGSRGDLILCDLAEYLVSEREREIVGSIHLRWLTDENAIRIKTRVDGQPGWSSPITPKNSSLTQSAFVTLEARE